MKESAASGEYEAFKVLLNRVMAVPHAVVAEREAEYKRCADLNPSKPGPKPKPKRKRRVSRDPAA